MALSKPRIISRSGKDVTGTSARSRRPSTNNSRSKPKQTAGSSKKKTSPSVSPMAAAGAANEEYGGSVTKEDVAERASKTVYPTSARGSKSGSNKKKQTKDDQKTPVSYDVSPMAAAGAVNEQFGGSVTKEDVAKKTKSITYDTIENKQRAGEKLTAGEQVEVITDRIMSAVKNPFKPINTEWEGEPEAKDRWVTEYIKETYAYDKVTGDYEDVKDRLDDTRSGIEDGLNDAVEGAKEAVDGVKNGINSLLVTQRKIFIAAIVLGVGYIVAKLLFTGKTVKTVAATKAAKSKSKK